MENEQFRLRQRIAVQQILLDFTWMYLATQPGFKLEFLKLIIENGLTSVDDQEMEVQMSLEDIRNSLERFLERIEKFARAVKR